MARTLQGSGLVVVGVHTPEYGHERILGNLEKAVKRFDITYPVAQDNDYETWNAYGNRHWPALHLQPSPTWVPMDFLPYAANE